MNSKNIGIFETDDSVSVSKLDDGPGPRINLKFIGTIWQGCDGVVLSRNWQNQEAVVGDLGSNDHIWMNELNSSDVGRAITDHNPIGAQMLDDKTHGHLNKGEKESMKLMMKDT